MKTDIIKKKKKTNVKQTRFDWWYMFIMVIYMAQATPETSRMIGTISGNPIPLLFPMILTYIVYRKHHVSFFDRNLYVIVGAFLIWAAFSLFKYKIFTTQELSYYFFPLYIIIVSFIQIKAYGKKLLPLYEDVMAVFCKIAVAVWLIAVLFPFTESIFRLFPETAYGNHVLYLFNWMDPIKGQVYGILRNAGCSWEPGRFAIMVVLAIFCNLTLRGIKFKGNNNIWWFLAALASTQSTTGFVTAALLYLMVMFRKVSKKRVLQIIFIVVPAFYGLWHLDFMQDKIMEDIEDAQDVSRLGKALEWNNDHTAEGEYLGSIDRFDAMVFESMNVISDPILGYSRNAEHSFFYTEISTNFVLANGLVKILGQHGVIYGTFIFVLLFISSFRLSKDFPLGQKLTLAVTLLLSSISYIVYSIPVFTTFWLYGVFDSQREKLSSPKKKKKCIRKNGSTLV